jgi:hypothetical protein
MNSICRFGIARADITPPVGIYHRMWGAAVHDRSEGIHRPLTATACVFRSPQAGDSPENQQVLVALDHCLLGRREMDTMLDEIQRRTNLPRECLLVVFSHTHAAGLMLLDRVTLPGGELIPEYLDKLNATISELVEQARRNCKPCTITYGTGRCNLAAHRDFWDEASNQWVCGYNPSGPADDTVMVANVTRESGEPCAVFVNYACHPTTLAWDNRVISPDYPGAMCETVENVLKVPCVFLQGTSGDLGPRYGYVGDVRVADQNGRQLGYAALSALTALPPSNTTFEYAGPVVSGATIGVWKYVPYDEANRRKAMHWQINRDRLMLPYRAGLPTLDEVESAKQHWTTEEQKAIDRNDAQCQRDCRAMVERQTRMITRLKQLPPGETFPFDLTVWRMGHAIWVAVQGESYSVLQTSLRQRFPDVPIVVCTLANGWGPSYLPTVELYDRGIYQESIAALAPGSLEHVIAEATTRIENLLV